MSIKYQNYSKKISDKKLEVKLEMISSDTMIYCLYLLLKYVCKSSDNPYSLPVPDANDSNNILYETPIQNKS